MFFLSKVAEDYVTSGVRHHTLTQLMVRINLARKIERTQEKYPNWVQETFRPSAVALFRHVATPRSQKLEAWHPFCPVSNW